MLAEESGLLTVIVPVYNEEGILKPFVESVIAVMDCESLNLADDVS